MSIYSIMAFNSAIKQAQDNQNNSLAVAQKKQQLAQAQEDLDLSKGLDTAKLKQARNEGLMSDYIGDALEKHLNEQYKGKQDVLDATSDIQDKAQHDAQVKTQQGLQVAQQLHATDPDVQNHVNTLSAMMAAKNGAPPMSMPNGSVSGDTAMGAPSPASSSSGPSVLPSTGLMTPSTPQTPQATDAMVTQGGVQSPSAPAQEAAPAPQQEIPTSQAQPAQPQAHKGGIDLSPIEQTFGMPPGSMWLNPSTMKPEVNPIWKSRIEKQQAAQAVYDINQPFREEQRQDRNIKTAETYLVNSLKQRGGAIGLQNNKVDAAIHARALINQAYDPATGDYNISQVPYGELSESMGALLSGQSGSSEGRIAALKQKTAQGDVNGAITYFTGKPSNATSQDAIKQLVGIIDRQGEVSEDLRDNAFNKLKELPTFSRLDDDTLQSLKDQHLGNSFKEFMKDAPDKQPQGKYKVGESRNIDGVTYTRGGDGKWYSQ